MKKMGTVMKRLLSCGKKSFPLQHFDKHLPEGHIPVCVGKDICSNFHLEANYLNHPLFEDLLQLSANEFGYSYKGPLRIACDVDLFLYLVDLLKSSDPSAHYMQPRDLISIFQASNHLKVIDSLHDIDALDAQEFTNTSTFQHGA